MVIAATPFTGFRPESIQFLADLAEHNDREWFTPRKADYERLIKGPFEALIGALAVALAARDVPLHADPKRSMFRIYRDTRFSRDKSPYKTHVGASFPWMEMTAAGYEVTDGAAHGNGGYFNFQPGEMYAGCGCPRRPASMRSGGRSSRIPTESGPRSRNPGSWPRSDR